MSSSSTLIHLKNVAKHYFAIRKKLQPEEIMKKEVNKFVKGTSGQPAVDSNAITKDSKVKTDTIISAEKNKTNKEERDTLGNISSYVASLTNLSLSSKNTKETIPEWRRRAKTSISSKSIDSRTRSLLSHLGELGDAQLIKRLAEFCSHLKTYPNTRGVAIRQNAIPNFLKLYEGTTNKSIKCLAKEGLALLGHVEPVKGHGIRILSIDGGGVRGLLAIYLLRELEQRAGQPIYKMFDFICGVSTGAIIAVLMGCKKLTLDECKELYEDISCKIFDSSSIRKTASSLVRQNSFYDSNEWSKVLQRNVGDSPLIESAGHEDTPKTCIVAAELKGDDVVKPFLFRNYTLPHHFSSQYDGSIAAKQWEAVRASAAAPTYFSEFKFDKHMLMDGGVMVNNPTAIAVHEALLLWPQERIQTVVSIGTGRHDFGDANHTSVSWMGRLRAIINSATDTEGVHATMQDLLPFGSYFRFNPYLSEMVALDETDKKKLDTMIVDAELYIRKNEDKVNNAVSCLQRNKNLLDYCRHYVDHKKTIFKAKL